jgi:hypothetical protein
MSNKEPSEPSRSTRLSVGSIVPRHHTNLRTPIFFPKDCEVLDDLARAAALFMRHVKVSKYTFRVCVLRLCFLALRFFPLISRL